ncbi:hypothetical protein G6F68_012540 [Rhizopus microsporus]|nr:hypothetical protein G6F68_012540 [Rhizopus microsporus]
MSPRSRRQPPRAHQSRPSAGCARTAPAAWPPADNAATHHAPASTQSPRPRTGPGCCAPRNAWADATAGIDVRHPRSLPQASRRHAARASPASAVADAAPCRWRQSPPPRNAHPWAASTTRSPPHRAARERPPTASTPSPPPVLPPELLWRAAGPPAPLESSLPSSACPALRGFIWPDHTWRMAAGDRVRAPRCEDLTRDGYGRQLALFSQNATERW